MLSCMIDLLLFIFKLCMLTFLREFSWDLSLANAISCIVGIMSSCNLSAQAIVGQWISNLNVLNCSMSAIFP